MDNHKQFTARSSINENKTSNIVNNDILAKINEFCLKLRDKKDVKRDIRKYFYTRSFLHI